MNERARTGALTVAALGVVFGDIGTSPLYTMRACYAFSGALPVPHDVVGICSLLLWTLIVVVCIKYVGFIMRVDHDGEGGILALLALAAKPTRSTALVASGALTTIVIVGAAMLLGDGLITPSISVISAIEGLQVISPHLQSWIVPTSVAVLSALFAIQVWGTERVGRLFGPAMISWFFAIGVAGAVAIAKHPAILAAIDPRQGIAFGLRHGTGGLFVLGGLVLAVTGVEALYADLSHFGRAPIVRAWYWLVFPSLVLAYLGEGSALLANPANLANPFYALTPGWTLVPMVALATIATVIASQALISGAFTLIEQAIALGLSPRMDVRHTSRRIHGQVYIPAVALVLAIGCVILVIAFKSSDRLAAAYGLAVSTTMLATSIAYFSVVTRVLGWRFIAAAAVVACFVIVDGSFVISGLPKLLDGGWLPVAISIVLTTIALTWLKGRKHLHSALAKSQMPIDEAARVLGKRPQTPATMVFLTPDPNGVPFVAANRWVYERACEEHVVILRVTFVAKPFLPRGERVSVERLSSGVTRVYGRFGYMERPTLGIVTRACKAQHLDLEGDDVSFIYAEPNIQPAKKSPVSRWQRWLFSILQRSSRSLPDDLRVPPERRVGIGVTVLI